MQRLLKYLALIFTLLDFSASAPLPPNTKADLAGRTPTWDWTHASDDTVDLSGPSMKTRRATTIILERIPVSEAQDGTRIIKKRDSGWGGKADVVVDGTRVTR